ncbi:pyruvate, phosphate dikinase [Radicibacter daui]|uniref:pyruvate, phosphate dikinase n=1 Tax=Radicibacter daui TaxID=3064829 RepID=UPI004046AA4F
MPRWVHSFARGAVARGVFEGTPVSREALGMQAALLADAAALDLPVPPGFTIEAGASVALLKGGDWPSDLKAQVEAALMELEVRSGSRLGGSEYPLVVAVRLGARERLPGLPRAILGVGLNDQTVETLARRSGNVGFAYEAYTRFIASFAVTVEALDPALFEEALATARGESGGRLDDIGWRSLAGRFKRIFVAEAGAPFPQDVREQFDRSVDAALRAWGGRRLMLHRQINNIPEGWGAAVTVQSMVFGALGSPAGLALASSRDPRSGAPGIVGRWLPGAMGDELDQDGFAEAPIARTEEERRRTPEQPLSEAHPDVFNQLSEIAARLERHWHDMVEFDTVVERGKVYLVGVRPGRRSVRAGLRIAVDLCRDGVIDKAEAVTRVDPASLDQLLHASIDPATPRQVLTRGIGASPGAATGRVVFSGLEAQRVARKGNPCILVRMETGPDDVHGQHAASGVLTARGGMTSHAAVVARGMGKPCVCGAGELRIDEEAETISIGGHVIKAGEKISIDGSTGEVIIGAVALVQPGLSADFLQLMEWADSFRRLRVRANADTARDAWAAQKFGAEGIGLCRTEHMFFEGDRIVAMRRMILAEDEAARREILSQLLPMQRADFAKLFHIMRGKPVTIRLLDPPLHEFLPKSDREMEEIAHISGTDLARVRRRTRELAEANPMLGHRGCRLGISYPEIYEMQARAIFEAAEQVFADTGETVIPEVMIPLVGTAREFEILKQVVVKAAAEVQSARGACNLEYLVGTMIELPRACLRAHEIALAADFFSFGTNDLTQTTYGMSRDDAASFLGAYQRAQVFETDPFVTIDRQGVGRLIRMAVEEGREASYEKGKLLHLGVCGEHGADPASVLFFEEIGLDYVSCSPFRVPVAQLAAAQAALRTNR